MGSLIDAVRRVPNHGCAFIAVEVNYELAQRLKTIFGLGKNAICTDFLAQTPEKVGSFERVLMNPPFENGQDVAHVLHAATFLKPGGILIAIMSAGVKFNQAKKYQNFRVWLDAQGGILEDLPPETFKASGTCVNTVLVKVEL